MSQAIHNLGGFGSVVLAKDFNQEFISAFEHINKREGVNISPLAGQSQVVNGINFAFYCFVEQVTAPDLPKISNLELITVYEKDGTYTQTSSRVISEPVLFPPIGSFDSVALRANFTDAEAQTAEQIESLVGVHYDILAAQQQVVAGLNFAFYAVVKPATLNGQAYFAQINAYRNLEGKIECAELHPIQP